jgi:aryl-alcohol dehydrogenase-like predicted oxidoreductase
VYTNGTSEKFVGELVKADRERFVVATKYSLMRRPGDPNGAGNQRKNLVHSLEASLRRTGLEYIDLYWVHAPDWVTPIEEIMRALDDVVRAGKVLYVGVSDMPAWQVSRGNAIAELRGWTSFAGLQIEYSLIERTPERELLPMARTLDIGVTTWGSLGGGVLTGKYRGEQIDSKRVQGNQGRTTPRKLEIADEVVKIAKEIDRSPSQVAINWVRQKPGVVIPIVGARTAAQLADTLGALDFRLSDEQLARLDAVSAIERGFPYDFLESPGIRTVVRGDLADQIDAGGKLYW